MIRKTWIGAVVVGLLGVAGVALAAKFVTGRLVPAPAPAPAVQPAGRDTAVSAAPPTASRVLTSVSSEEPVTRVSLSPPDLPPTTPLGPWSSAATPGAAHHVPLEAEDAPEQNPVGPPAAPVFPQVSQQSGGSWSAPAPVQVLSAGSSSAPRQAGYSTAALPPRPTLSGLGLLQPMPALAATPLGKHPARSKAQPLTGTHPCVLEEQNILLLPSVVRGQLDDPAVRTLFATPGPDACVWLFTAAGLEHWAEQIERASAAATRVRAARRLCFAQTESCVVDRGGRLQVPERLVDFAGLRQDVVLLGVGDHLELWDAERWQQYRLHQSPEPPLAHEPVRDAAPSRAKDEEERSGAH